MTLACSDTGWFVLFVCWVVCVGLVFVLLVDKYR